MLVQRSKRQSLKVKNVKIVLNLSWNILKLFPWNVFPPPNTHISGDLLDPSLHLPVNTDLIFLSVKCNLLHFIT